MKRARGVVKDLSKPEMGSGQTFFKGILSSEKLEIPPGVGLQMQGALANSVILRDRYKNMWPVEVARNGDDLCFDKGWAQVYRENSLEPGNFLVFEYKGDNLFDFKLLGGNACEKKGVGALKFRVKEEELEEYKAEDEEEEDEELVDSEEYDDDGDDDDDDDEDYVQEEEEDEEEEQVNISKKIMPKSESKSSRMCNRNLSRSNSFGVGKTPSKHKYRKKNATEKKGEGALMCKVKEEKDDEVEGEELAGSDDNDENDEDEGYMPMEGEYDEEEEQVNISKKIKAKLKSKSSRALERNLSRGNTFGIGTIPSKRRYKKKNVPDCYGADIFKSGLAPRPKNPYFVTRSRTPRRKNELYIPKDVIVDYHLVIPEKLFLVDEKQRKWETKIKQWKDGRLWCTRGWRSLCNVNNIERDDACICEFVQGEGCKDLYICVRLVNGVGR
ncbi:hypothetical protein Pfo_018101 [Paulownia fortunei]|nr:hypothetical protein Pfo_018101 [Paulownia fortunei]